MTIALFKVCVCGVNKGLLRLTIQGVERLSDEYFSRKNYSLLSWRQKRVKKLLIIHSSTWSLRRETHFDTKTAQFTEENLFKIMD